MAYQIIVLGSAGALTLELAHVCSEIFELINSLTSNQW